MAREYVFNEEDLREWKLVKDFREALNEVMEPGDLIGASWESTKRKLELGDYLSLFLFTLFNPVFETTRAICKACDLERVQREISGGKVSLGSFSEAQHLVQPEWLERVFKHLIKKSGPSNRAVRLHLSFNLLDHQPESALVTPANVCERKAWRQQWQRGAAYIGDSYYGTSYRLFDELEAFGCNYILRLKDQALLTEIQELPLSKADLEARVVKQALVRLGARPTDKLYRVVWVDTPTAGMLRIVTSLDCEECPAQQVAQLYRQRWQIESFFKWLKVLEPTLRAEHY